MATKVGIPELVKASRSHVQRATQRADQNRDGALSKAELDTLPKDLRDNVKAAGGQVVDVKTFARAFVAHVAASARRADTNRDGYLTLSEGKRLPQNLQDNFKNYVAATRDVHGGSQWKVKDTTAAATRAAHLATYGASPVSYEQAFAKAIDTVMRDESTSETPRSLIKFIAKNQGRSLTNAQVDAKLKKLFKGLELLPVGVRSESGADPQTHWIFSLDCDVGTDHTFWVSVDRHSGEAFVNGFN